MKYIVYKTTNKVNNYVYYGVHKTANPDIFDGYLGCGINIKIPYTYEHAKTKFQQAVKEFGFKNFIRETISVFDTSEEAYELEGIIVNENFLARFDVYNTMLGGVPNNAQGIKVFQYNLNGEFINEFDSYESAGKTLLVQPSSIRRAVLYKYKVKDCYFNTDKLDKLDLSLYNNNIIKVRVYRYLKNGSYDSEFESYGEASRASNTSASNIRGATYDGYCVKNNWYFSFIKSDNFSKARSIQIREREVHQYDENGNYIKSYSTQYEAEQENPYSNITKSIKFKSLDENGFMWSLEKLNNYNVPKIPKNRKKKVGLYDNKGNLIKTWESARQCAKEVGGAVQNVLNGKYKKHKGQIYKYIE